MELRESEPSAQGQQPQLSLPRASGRATRAAGGLQRGSSGMYNSRALRGARSPDGEQQDVPVLLLRGDSWVMVALHHDPALQEVTPDTMATVRA